MTLIQDLATLTLLRRSMMTYGQSCHTLSGIGSLLPSTMVSEPRSYPESLLKALICIFRSVVGVEEDIIELLTIAHKAFTAANNPLTVVKSLRSKVLEAKDLHIECKWSQTGAKIVETLCLDNHNMKAEEWYKGAQLQTQQFNRWMVQQTKAKESK